jgi:hypothetical protein
MRTGKFEKVDSKTFPYKLIPKYFLYKLIERFVDGGFGNPWEPPFNRIYGTQ